MKVKKKRTRYHYDSDSSLEDIPLAGFRKVNRENRKDALHSWSVEKCEFCEEVFYNKYNMLVHNASHIIIPLLKQKYHQCPECLHHFTSIECLEWHTINKHPYVTRNNVPELLSSLLSKEPAIVVKKPTAVNSDLSRNESLLQCFVKQQPITVLTREKFNKNNTVNICEVSDGSCHSTAASDIGDNELETSGSEIVAMKTEKVSVGKCYVSNEIVNGNIVGNNSKSNLLDCKVMLKPCDGKRIKDRLMFEDNDVLSEADSLINDLTTDCTVKLETFDEDWINRIRNGVQLQDGYASKGNAIILGNKPKAGADGGWMTPVEGRECSSVHYDELVRPMLYQCSRCDETLPNRFLGIVHETTHLSTVLRKLVLTKPPVAAPPAPPLGNYVELERHPSHHHPGSVMCMRPGCGRQFPSLAQLEAHGAEHGAARWAEAEAEPRGWSSKIVRVCDLCCSFFRNKVNLTYEFFGEKNRVGERHPCERCQKYFFSLNVVRLRYKKHTKHHLEEIPPPKKKSCSNAERLKNVRLRLKKLKSLNRF